jgi:hypothetical protein
VIPDLAATATRTLAAHWAGRYTVPSRQLYPHQWSWDSAFVAFGLRHVAPDHAEQELISLFQAQWTDGRVPHIAFDPAVAADAYYPGPDFWRSRDFGGTPIIATTGLIQPPIHAWAAWATYQADPDTARARGFLERLYPALVAWHQYLYRRRSFTGNGLVALVHPWETGMDNSPSWDRPLARIDPLPSTVLRRHDLEHAQPAERPTDRDYGRYMRIATAYRDRGYADEPDKQLFAVEDPLTNALLVVSERALAQMATVLGHDPHPHQAHADRVATALTEHLFDAEAGIFFARDIIAGELLREYTIGGLAPLIVPGLPVAKALVKTALGERFQLGRSHLLPSYDITAPGFEPARYWRGPGWFNTTWLIWQGLLRHGELAHADALHRSLLTTAAHAGLREYVDPISGAGHGAPGLSWSAAVVLDALRRHPSTQAMRERQP